MSYSMFSCMAQDQIRSMGATIFLRTHLNICVLWGLFYLHISTYGLGYPLVKRLPIFVTLHKEVSA
jgi:hypothetical protein